VDVVEVQRDWVFLVSASRASFVHFYLVNVRLCDGCTHICGLLRFCLHIVLPLRW